ncbi:NAD(P)H-dependent flavin oxidoreductase [Desulfolucanica intricata]|uniref:NAD(P)H-dependent flavin oxidoreductase n=1 Tax=Desulfolucanica intricata TaxID=1285191 RepID=UPI000832F337|nr:nitronate monooxygenase [Desulfolucanica intricata]
MKLPTLKIKNLLPKYPIVQGGMAVKVSTAPLAAAVANAGGIGIIGATGMSLEELREEIRTAKNLSKGIIGINIMFAAKQFAGIVKAAIEEKIDVIFSGAGFSRDIFGWGEEAEVPIVSIVSSAKAAKLAERSGAAAVVAEGFEAGGHLGTDQSIEKILPEIRAAVKIPVIAAGGIVDGTDMARMVKMGANGVQMGTRFVLSEECTVHDSFKQAYLRAQKEDVQIIKSPVGLPGRAITNIFAQKIMQGEAPKPKHCDRCLKNCSADYCILAALNKAKDGLIDQGVIFSGQNVYRIKEILPVQKIFEKLLAEFKMSRE